MQQHDISLPENVPADRLYDIDVYRISADGADYHRSWVDVAAGNPHGLIWTPHNGGHWIVTRAPLIEAVLNGYQYFSSRLMFVPKSSGEEYSLAPTTLDPPEHRPYRTIINGGLAPKVINRIEALLPDLAGELIGDFLDDGHCNFTTQYAELFPIRIFMGLVDLPMEDALHLKSFADHISRPDGTMSYAQALKGLNDYLAPVVASRRGGDGQDMLSRIVNSSVHGRPVDDREALEMCSQTLLAGLDTVVNMLSFIMMFLATHDEHRRDLATDRGKIPDFVNEILRRFGIAMTGRVVTQDYPFEGVMLKKGDMVIVPTALYGLDPAVNPDPFEVDVTRRNGRHATFGSGHHICPGAHLARMEIRITLEQWFDRIPEFRLASDIQPYHLGGIIAGVREVPLVW